MEFERASLELDGAVAVLRMNHPEVLNAVSPEMLKGMTEALDVLAASNERVRCLVLTGVGRAFSTGANLQGRGDDGLAKRGAGRTLETSVPSLHQAAAGSALSGRHRGQRGCRRRRHESCAVG